MKKLEKSELEGLQGGCNRWARRAAKAEDTVVRDAYLSAFAACIANKYT